MVVVRGAVRGNCCDKGGCDGDGCGRRMRGVTVVVGACGRSWLR